MKTVFVAIIFFYEASTGQPIDAATAVFTDQSVCEQQVSYVIAKASNDMLVYAEGQCVEAPLVVTE